MYELNDFLAAFAALSSEHLFSLVSLGVIAVTGLAIFAVLYLARDRRR